MEKTPGNSLVLHVLRGLFILLMASVGWFFVRQGYSGWAVAILLVIGVFIVCIDILMPRRKLAIFSGTFFGLIVGLLIAFILSFVVELYIDQYTSLGEVDRITLVRSIDLAIGVVCCYLAISFILQTKDDFRFIVPYVEFSKQRKGPRPVLLDTSVLIDGRIHDVGATGMIESQLFVPRFVLQELQLVADSADKLKRNRGRRGLDTLKQLQDNRKVEVVLYEGTPSDAHEGVDQQLVALAHELNARILTNDFNLNKVAQLRGVDVININDLANALKPVVLPGEKMVVRMLKPGEASGQGVGYLDDGTMVVVEGGRQHLEQEVEFTVTSALQTSAGRMIFGRILDADAQARRGGRARQEPTHST